MKLKLVRITKIICFCMVAVLMVGGLTDLLKPKWLENRWVSAKTNKSFYELQDNSAEVVFLEQVLFQQQWIRSSYMRSREFLHII